MNRKSDLTYNCTMRTYRPINLNVLWFLIALNVLIFILEIVIGEYPIERAGEIVNKVVLLLGLRPDQLSQQPWTIISSMFVHGGFAHILFNTISLYFLGSFFLRAVGERSFLAVFFLGGLAGNALYILLAPPNVTGIGASGAIFAIGGALAVLVPRVPVYIFFIPIAMPLWVAILIFFLLSFLFSGIAWQAHLGGLLGGLIAGFVLRRRRRIDYF
ncbi:MAG: rhomboid family intramembrane serine protease [Dehalococcoidia bacterium]|nr:rhomboid family intramembrane serine protease [Dehalococcoidia bacterium]